MVRIMANITRVERKILANQYAILEKIDPERAEQYAELREVLEDGFEAEYGDVLRHVYDEPDTMTAEECSYVGDVMQMYDMMQSAFKNGQTANVEAGRLKFSGFDGNNETKFMAYARHMRKYGKWTFLELSSEDFNSHYPTESRYREMLARWDASNNKHQLSSADIIRILG
jgi:uncharacterized protein YfbU (UPF0304 family)